MNQYDDVLRKLESERQRLIGVAATAKQQRKAKTKADAEGRAAYLAGVARALWHDAHGGILPSHVFVAYAERTGGAYYEYVRKQLVEKHGLMVKTGFDKDPSREANVLARVLNALNQVSMFVGILTKEHEIRSNEQTTWAPSVWTSEEKGMALALRHSFVLLVEEGVHPDYWLKTAPADLHFIFRTNSFYEKADEALEVLVQKFKNRRELLLRDAPEAV